MPKVDVADYKQLYRATRNFSPEIRRAFRKRLKDAAQIGARGAKLKVRAMPATRKYTATGAGRQRRGGKSRGLRSTLAANIRVQVGAKDVAVRQFSTGISGRSARDLPRDIDRGDWLHPTFGHEPEVLQTGWPYFMSTMREKRPEMEREVRKVLDDIQAKVIAGRLHIG